MQHNDTGTDARLLLVVGAGELSLDYAAQSCVGERDVGAVVWALRDPADSTALVTLVRRVAEQPGVARVLLAFLDGLSAAVRDAEVEPAAVEAGTR